MKPCIGLRGFPFSTGSFFRVFKGSLIALLFCICGPAGAAAVGEPMQPDGTRSAPADSPNQAPVFTSGSGGYHTYRIPALAITSKGTILAFCEGRKNSRADDGDIDLLMRRSFDHGRTWQEVQKIWDDGENTIGNPCPVLDKTTGVIWLLFCRNNDRVFVTKSDDDGTTWAEPVDITADVKAPTWTWYATGPGHGIQLDSGRLLIPCDHRDRNIGGVQFSHVFLSDDHGKSWRRGGSLAENTDECMAVQTVDGDVYLNMRSYQKKNRRAVARSRDGGQTWSDVTLDQALVEPVCQASLIRLTDTARHDKNRVLFANPASTRREIMTVRISYDECHSWSRGKVLHPGPSAYSDLVVLKDRTIGCLYERGANHPYEAIIFARFSLDWLTDRDARLGRDILWIWGNPEMAQEGSHTLDSYAEASPAQRAQMLGVPNVIMAGRGLPDNDAQAEAETRSVQDFQRLVWEISPGDEPWVQEDAIARIRTLANKYPKIEGVLLDDLSTVKIQKGFQPEHIRDIRRLLGGENASVDIWGVWYTMNLHDQRVLEYIQELDVINLWTWHARDLPRLEENVAHCARLFPDKPIVLGLYLYDYGEGRRMPLDLLEQQCETALRLAHDGRIAGIVFLTINNDPDALRWTADWIQRAGNERLGSAVAEQPAGQERRKRSAGEPSQPAPTPGSPSGSVVPSSDPAASPAPLSEPSPIAADAGSVRNQPPALRIGDGRDWAFLGGAWTETAAGVIHPPNEPNRHSRAFFTKHGHQDLTAEFEFNADYRETGSGGAGFVFRATDANHFYMVYFPWGGQQLRAKHFWASLVKVDGDGYLRSLKSVWIPGVPSETDRWYKVRLETVGARIRVWVDGRRAFSVTDGTYSSGAVGFAGYGWYAFRNIRIAGEKKPLEIWHESPQIPTHHFHVGLDSQNMPTGCLAPNGDVLLAAGNQLVRSKDKGRTWSVPETLPEKLGTLTDYGNSMFRTSQNRLIVQLWRSREQTKQERPEILIAESDDSGSTWSDPEPAHVADGWPELPQSLTCYGPLVETADGTLLRFLLGGTRDSHFSDVRTWSATHAKAYAIRSSDGGKSWSAPIEMDQPSWSGIPRGSIPGSLDFTEPTGVAIGNQVTVLIRPIYSPMMWQCWSNDSGVHWDAAARATFPGYAQSLIRTQSGAILCAHRYPHYSVNVSHDGARNWDEGTVIDYPVWGMGCLIEVEPNVVLCTYMNAQRNMPLLAQLIGVTPEGIRPISK